MQPATKKQCPRGFVKAAVCGFCVSNVLPAFEHLSLLCMAAENQREARLKRI
jgi:hypothetical protein